MDQYEELEVIGTGAFGKVCKIRRKSDNKILVWKELNYGAMNEQEKQQLVAEVNILRELRNPFIVRYYDRIVDKRTTRLYIVMEYCAGGDLGKIIRKCKRDRTNLDEEIIWRIFSQIVLALKDCHRRVENGERKPILHRDLKPANIMLDQDENLKIGDFGLAKELSSESKLARTNVGTPFYMSPELVNGNKYDERSDIWAVGCLLYELASLRPPFDAPNQLTLAMKITAGRFHRIPNKYSDNLQNAIKSMLQVDSSKRPRIEDLTNLPALQPALRQSNLIIKEAQMNLSYSTKWRELKSREIALNEKEENLRRLEEQLNTREKSLLAREKRIQSAERQSITSLPHQQKVGVRRSNSLPVATVIPPPNILYEQTIEESEEEGEENRRMSLQMDDPIPICEPDQPRGWIPTTAAPQPFKIYSEEATEPNHEAKRDEFTNGVARARELLNRPRLMTRNSDYYPSGATGSTFYKNYLANKKASEVGQGIENIKPASMIFEKNKNQVGGVGNGNGGNDGAGNGCGSATKRSRKEYETMENGNEGKGVPSVQVDLHSLMMAGRGKFDNL